MACISFLFSTDRCSHLSAPGEYSVKTKDISTEFAILLSDLAEGKLPSWTPACSRGNIEQVREMTGNDTVATENETAHRVSPHCVNMHADDQCTNMCVEGVLQLLRKQPICCAHVTEIGYEVVEHPHNVQFVFKFVYRNPRKATNRLHSDQCRWATS